VPVAGRISQQALQLAALLGEEADPLGEGVQVVQAGDHQAVLASGIDAQVAVDAELEQQLLDTGCELLAVGGVLDGDGVAGDLVDAAVALEQRHQEGTLGAGTAGPDDVGDRLVSGLLTDEVSERPVPERLEVLYVELVDLLAGTAQRAVVDVAWTADESVVRLADVVEVLQIGVVEAGALLAGEALGRPPPEERAELHLVGHG